MNYLRYRLLYLIIGKTVKKGYRKSIWQGIRIGRLLLRILK
ncbi:hypothetical protein [Streptococcus uberis]|nr:hypothetical protein [Streptococcus uberis]